MEIEDLRTHLETLLDEEEREKRLSASSDCMNLHINYFVYCCLQIEPSRHCTVFVKYTVHVLYTVNYAFQNQVSDDMWFVLFEILTFSLLDRPKPAPLLFYSV